MIKEHGPRLSVEMPEDLYKEFNDLIGTWRIRAALFRKIVYDLVIRMRKMTPSQRRLFIVSIVEGEISIEEWSSIFIKRKEKENEN